MAKILGLRGSNNRILTGSGYIYVPNDVDRTQFIISCYNTCTVSILTGDGQRYDNVQVSRSIFYELYLPESVKEIGSLVFYVKYQKRNQPVVIAVLNKRGEVLGYQKGQFAIKKESNTGIVNILGDSNNGNLFITTESDSGGNITINAKNTNFNNKLKLNVDGDVESFSSNFNSHALNKFQITVKNELEEETETVIKYTRGEGFSYLDENNNSITINEDGFKYEGEKGTFEIDADGKFSFSNDNYSIKDLLIDILKEIEAIKTPTSIGLNPPSNVANFTTIRTDKLIKILK